MLDFVGDAPAGSERSFYDDYYHAHASEAGASISLSSLQETWTSRRAPWEMQRTWRRLGDLKGRRVLLLGNGESYNELSMLTQEPELLIYSDLSPVGVASIRARFGDHAHVAFAAIEGLALPLLDESVDVVYGYAFVHHLPDIDRFLVEVARVLRPGGSAVFMDNGYSPLWQQTKLSVLKPLMQMSHRRAPRSPEDVEETLAGGFREPELARSISAAGGVPRFERVALLYYLWKRLSVSLFPEAMRFIPGHDVISEVCKGIDRRLARFPRFQSSMIRLIWGFDLP